MAFHDADGDLLMSQDEPGIRGAVLVLKQGTVERFTATSRFDGAFILSGVPVGQYTVAEKSAPAGYKPNANQMTIEVTGDGVWTILIGHEQRPTPTVTPTRTRSATPGTASASGEPRGRTASPTTNPSTPEPGATPAPAKLGDAFWSPLTDFEIRTLADLEKAKAGDPDALLALAIFASGNVRTEREFAAIQDRVDRFIEEIRPAIEEEAGAWQKGRKLHAAMHEEFFAHSVIGGELAGGYEESQSQLSVIFETRRFNCISSSLLYIVLARYFDLDVKGVLLPSHAFVQIETPGGEVIEVETTSSAGFGLRHDQRFYQDQAEEWMSARGLRPSTFEDYKNREIVAPYRLIAENLGNQHTSPDRMNAADRARLQEARGYLEPDNPEAQLARLIVYHSELMALLEEQDPTAGQRLMETIQPTIDRLRARLRGFDRNQVVEMSNMISSLHLNWGNALFEEEDFAEAIRQYEQGLQWAESDELSETVRSNIGVAYLNWGNAFFDAEDYAGAIDRYEQALQRAASEELEEKALYNAGSAYWNRAVPSLNTGDGLGALEVFQECLERFPQVGKCREGIEEVCARYSLRQCPQ